MSKSFWNINDLPSSTCSICIDEITFKNCCTILLPCGHVFHYGCFAQIRNSSCPFCRLPIEIPCQLTLPQNHTSTGNNLENSNINFIYLIGEID